MGVVFLTTPFSSGKISPTPPPNFHLNLRPCGQEPLLYFLGVKANRESEFFSLALVFAFVKPVALNVVSEELPEPKFLQAKQNAASLSTLYSSQSKRLYQLALKDLVFCLET